jgi:peroxiredoxin
MSRRAVFVIGQDGQIRYKWVTDDPLIPPDVDQVIVCLRELRQGPASAE